MLNSSRDDKSTDAVTQEPAESETETKTTETALIRECPDQWIDNQMPSLKEDDSLPSEYFIFDGERKETKDYDVEWIKANCSVKVQKIY